MRGLTRCIVAYFWQSEVQKAESKKNLLRNTQGVHAAMRLNMEQTILSQYRRLPGFHSEFMGLEIMQDSMSKVGVEDVLNGKHTNTGNTCVARFLARWVPSAHSRISVILEVKGYLLARVSLR